MFSFVDFRSSSKKLLALTLLGATAWRPAQAAPSSGSATLVESRVTVPVEKPVPVGEFRAQLVEATSFIRAAEARASHNVDGSGLTIAVLDTGINETHNDFTGRIVLKRNYSTADGGNINIVTDRHGHGTNVASLAMAHGPDTGIAPGANVAVFKVLGDTGSGSDASINNALQWLVDHAAEYNISVVNMSLGYGDNLTDDANANSTQKSLISQLRAKNIAVVVAAGNAYGSYYAQGMSQPAIDRDTVSVGAVYDANIGPVYYSGSTAYTTAAGRITPFSQRLHPTVGNAACRTDIFAPGAALTGAGITGDNSASTMHGTSQATPILGGVILLMQQKYKALYGTLPPVDLIETWLRSSAVTINDGDDEDDSVPNTGLNFPRVDALNALDAVGSGSLLASIPQNTAVTEASGGVVLHIPVTLSAPATSAVSVNWTTQDGTATSPGDYSAAAGTLNFAIGEQTKNIDVTVNDDQLVENSEKFTVKLTGGSGIALVDSLATNTITITDNDTIYLTSPLYFSTQTNDSVPLTATTSSTGVTAMKFYRTALLSSTAGSGAIPTGSALASPVSISSTVPVINRVYVSLSLTHPIPSQLSVSLRTNTGSVYTLSQPSSNTVYTVALPTSATAANGTWTLNITDNVSDTNTGTLNSWTLIAVPQTGAETLIGTAPSADVNGKWNSTWDLTTTPNGVYRVTARSFNDTTQLGEANNDGVRVAKPLYPPTDISLTPTAINENVPLGSTVGSFTSTDATASDSFTYSLVSGTGSDDNASFTIVGDALKTATTFDYLTKSNYSIRVRTTDGDGLSFERPLNITILEVPRAPDTTKPTITISTPTVNQKLLSTAFVEGAISGMAQDNVRIKSVKVRLSRKRGTQNFYWNGTDFVTTQSTVLADVTGTSSATWTLGSQLPPASKLDSGAYAVQVSAYDLAGNKSDYADRTFSLSTDFTAPTLTITAPTLNQKLLVSDFIAGAAKGTAADAVGVTAVKVRLSRKVGTTTTYWNGSDFVTSSSTVDADLAGTTSANWKLQTKAPPADKLIAGVYGLAVYAVDAAGNKSTTLSTSFSLSTDFVAPSVTISTPLANLAVNINSFGAGTITGQADDNLGVTSVKIKLQRSRNGVLSYWNGTDFTPTVALVETALTRGTGTPVMWQLDQLIPANRLDKGGYTVYATAYDEAGNTKTSASRSFTVYGTASAAWAPLTAPSSAGGS